jgi:hypothetical protein
MDFFARIIKPCFKLILLLVLIPIFVPLAPKMPDSGIDPSWAMALNQAVAQHLSFGKDIIFTLGPYASIYTKMYHPATDGMMLWGSLYLACSYWFALMVLMNRVAWHWLLAFIGLVVGMIYVKDSLFFSYPLLLAIISYQYVLEKKSQFVFWFALFAPLGLLMLIKSSFIMICFLSLMLCVLFFILNHQIKRALICLFAPLSSMGFFWLLSGQNFGDLPDYLVHSVYFVFSFTEAMAKDGNYWEIIFYLISAFFILLLISKHKPSSPYGTVFLVLQWILFLFLSFKTGFTRHNHAIIAGTSLLIAAFLLPFILAVKYRLAVMVLAVTSGIYIISHYRALSLKDNLISTYSSSWYGFTSRIQDKHWLTNNFNLIMEFHRAKAGIPLMPGKTDIYSYEQTLLLASGNIWSPRPVFQSYSTFTKLFTEKNKQYLEGEKAPDSILFRIEPIDERLPALEDGASWPLLLKKYHITHQDQRFLYLQKKNNAAVTLTALTNESHYLGQKVSTPEVSQPLFITLELKPSLFGYLSMLFFKISSLTIICELEDGSQRQYRLSAGMAKANFLLSPLVENTAEFALLHADKEHLQRKRVKSFTIQSALASQWQTEYQINFKTVY